MVVLFLISTKSIFYSETEGFVSVTTSQSVSSVLILEIDDTAWKITILNSTIELNETLDYSTRLSKQALRI
jgi:hypothetical protein